MSVEMPVNTLKNKIIELAIHGKLVSQDPNDELACVLLERIRAEKEQLIKEGKIKREKNPSVIFRGKDNKIYEKIGNGEPVCIEDEIPFEIPDSWEWVRLGSIFSHNTGKALNASNVTGKLLKYITTSNLYWNRFELADLREMYFDDAEVEKCTVSRGDLLVCEGGDFGRAAIWDYNYDICIQNHIHRLRAYIPLSTKFYYYVFYLYKHSGLIDGRGIGMQGLSSNVLHNILVPLPSFGEQERIVGKLDDACNQIDSISRNRIALKNDASALQKKILSLAIQGKLVPQDKNDEPASVLLERIRFEKVQMVNEGKIKREKNPSTICRGADNKFYEKISNGEPVCIEDEIPFNIPDSWEWVRFYTVCTAYIGDSISESDKKNLYSNLIEGRFYVGTKDIGFDNCNCQVNLGMRVK